MKKYVLFIGVACLIVSSAYAQQSAQSQAPAGGWPEMMRNHDVNFYDVQKEFNRWKAEHDLQNKVQDVGEEEGEDGSELYYRWANIMEPRVYPTGVRPDAAQIYIGLDEYHKRMGTPAVN